MTSGLLTLILLAATPTPEAAGGLDELVATLAPVAVVVVEDLADDQSEIE